MTDRDDRIAGCMFGAAIGDALGAAFEFMSAAEIERHIGSAFVRQYYPAAPGSLLYPREAGQPTDDTAMALSVAKTIARSIETSEQLDEAAFARGFLEDLEPDRGSFADMFWNGGPGGATTRALRRLQRGADPNTNGHPEDGGNGTAMRAHPVGFLEGRDAVLRVAAAQARVTHGHPSAVASAQCVAALVWEAINEEPLRSGLPGGIDDAELAQAWAATHDGLVQDARMPASLLQAPMSAWSTVATAHAIVWVFADAPLDAIAAAAASGGDTDTVATIVGALVGARIGKSSFPAHLIDGLRPKTLLSDAVLPFFANAPTTR